MTQIYKQQFLNLENIWKKDENGVEYILARDLARVLGYEGKDYWRHFKNVVEKAKIACKHNNYNTLDHFADTDEMVTIGSGAKRKIDDYKLSRYACYLTAQASDPRKQQVAFALNYFATSTRKLELIEQRMQDFERILERNELKEAERIFSEEIYQRDVEEGGFARIRSKGDKALFNKTTEQMKEKLAIPYDKRKRPLADFLDPALITAKKLAVQLSNIAIKQKDLKGEKAITDQHTSSNSSIREVFIKEAGVKPEDLPPSEDIKKVETRLKKRC